MERAKEMARVQIHCNHPDKAHREIWGRAHNRYDDALESIGPRGLAELVWRDLYPNALTCAVVDAGEDAADAEDTEAPRPTP